VLITGGGMGVGRGLAERYGGLGYHVIVWDVLPSDELDAIANEIKAHRCPDYAIVEGYHVDVTSIEAVANASRVLEERGLVPDLLVLNAGIVNGRRIIAKPSVLPQVKRLLDVNVFHLFNVTSHVMPRMINAAVKEEMKSGQPLHRGIVVLGSVAGFAGTARMCDYNASKAAANVFAEALAAEIKASCGGSVGMRVTLVCPYQINTGMFKGAKTITGFRELRTEDVVAAIVDGVSLKKRLIVLPRVLLLYLAFKAVVPWWMLSWADWLLGGSRAIGNDFRGRHGAGASTSGRGTPQHGSATPMAEPPSIEALIARRKHSSPPPPFVTPADVAPLRKTTRPLLLSDTAAAPGSSSSTSPNQPRLTVDFPESPAAAGGCGGANALGVVTAIDDPEVSTMLAAEGLRAAASAETLPPHSPTSSAPKGGSADRADVAEGPSSSPGSAAKNDSKRQQQGLRKRRAASKT
jgi:all-trans-retinol dehydrogenase (NAD+)